MSVVQEPNTVEPVVEQNSTSELEVPEDEKRPWLRYVLIAVLVVGLCCLLYYGIAKWSELKESGSAESMTKGVEQERDDPVVDFNLREAIKNLQSMQKKVLSQLSEVSDI